MNDWVILQEYIFWKQEYQKKTTNLSDVWAAYVPLA